jgi:hypothetical protein
MNGRQGSMIRAITDRWDPLEIVAGCLEWPPMLLIVAAVCLLRYIFAGSGGGVS